MKYKTIILFLVICGYGTPHSLAMSWETEDALHIERKGIKDAQLNAIIQSRPSPLKTLSLPGNPITDAGLGEITILSSLVYLNLADTKLNNDSVITLAKSLSSLKTLDLSYVPFEKSGAKAIGECLPQLENLTLVACQLKPSACSEITSNLQNLHHLNMAFNYFDSEGTHSFVSTPHPFLSCLNLKFNLINSLDVLILGRSEWFKNIREVNLSHNSIGSYALNYIAKNLVYLEVLELSHSGVSDDQAVMIAETLHKLHLLNLEHNDIGDRGVLALVRAPFHKLRLINLLLNSFGDRGKEALERFKEARKGQTFVYWHPL